MFWFCTLVWRDYGLLSQTIFLGDSFSSNKAKNVRFAKLQILSFIPTINYGRDLSITIHKTALPHRLDFSWRHWYVISAPTFSRLTAGDVNIALHKQVYSNPPGHNLGNAVDGEVDTEASMGDGSMPFIAVDLGSRYMIDEIHILIRRVGKLNWTMYFL